MAWSISPLPPGCFLHRCGNEGVRDAAKVIWLYRSLTSSLWRRRWKSLAESSRPPLVVAAYSCSLRHFRASPGLTSLQHNETASRLRWVQTAHRNSFFQENVTSPRERETRRYSRSRLNETHDERLWPLWEISRSVIRTVIKFFNVVDTGQPKEILARR